MQSLPIDLDKKEFKQLFSAVWNSNSAIKPSGKLRDSDVLVYKVCSRGSKEYMAFMRTMRPAFFSSRVLEDAECIEYPIE